MALSPESIPGVLVHLMDVSGVQGYNCEQEGLAQPGEFISHTGHLVPHPGYIRVLPRNEVEKEEFVFGTTYREAGPCS